MGLFNFYGKKNTISKSTIDNIIKISIYDDIDESFSSISYKSSLEDDLSKYYNINKDIVRIFVQNMENEHPAYFAKGTPDYYLYEKRINSYSRVLKLEIIKKNITKRKKKGISKFF